MNEKMPKRGTKSGPLTPSLSPSEMIVSHIFLAGHRSREMPFKASLINRVACSAEKAVAMFHCPEGTSREYGVLTPGNMPHGTQVPKGRLKDAVWDWTSAVPSGLATFWRPTQR